MVLFQKSSSGS